MSVEVMRSVIEAAEGRVPVDTLFTNAQIVDVYGQRVAPGNVAVKDGVIVGVLYDGRDDAAGTYEAAEVIDCQGRYLAYRVLEHPSRRVCAHGGDARHHHCHCRQPRDR